MSTAANIALLIIAIQLIVALSAILTITILAGLTIVESTGLTRRFLRRQATAAKRLEHQVDAYVNQALVPNLVKVERLKVWATAFVRSIRRNSQP